jgi:hypothetical protein
LINREEVLSALCPQLSSFCPNLTCLNISPKVDLNQAKKREDQKIRRGNLY